MITSFKIFENKKIEVEIGGYYNYIHFTPNYRIFKVETVKDDKVFATFKNDSGMWLWIKNIDRKATDEEIEEFKMHEKTRKFNV